ncbi:uncharacterized protein B0H18DRAFT_666135 [Fomitopsis serialis]|uniref:uncharacterized protein n=1 Tax=Fomitopsis serialis TaxID=139415 RepID=UPI002007B79F|nr:uncharacterized protein B0H18DRAFT_667443 [Neoantrodia serialis]XP_047889047.1 uncharacterized protein B0H18DRAFT_666135 [Neoantrodia serialis]KAH9918507.1 hypothetical protein B0H18DRAFT_667443 [Neoantrodia serialis]KAH9918625.1 hypothetical protein B0H18DRAFT_666135 [Neoantrodia serialis]
MVFWCRWANCDAPLDDQSAAGIKRHLQQDHAADMPPCNNSGQSLGHSHTMCRWSDHQNSTTCGKQTQSAHQYARHVAAVHLRYYQCACKRCGNLLYWRDALRRHQVGNYCRHCEDPKARSEGVDHLLRAAGPSLTCARSVGTSVLTSFEHNTALRSFYVDINADDVREYQFREGCLRWVAEDLCTTLSTVRGQSLEQITLSGCVEVAGDCDNGYHQAIEELDLEELHSVMTRPCFNALLKVKVQWNIKVIPDSLCASAPTVDGIAQEFATHSRRFFRPWDERGIVCLLHFWE